MPMKVLNEGELPPSSIHPSVLDFRPLVLCSNVIWVLPAVYSSLLTVFFGTSPFLVPSDSSELAATLLPVPTAGATPPFCGANACSWAEAAGTQRGASRAARLAAAGMAHALGRRTGGSAAEARLTGGMQAARVNGARCAAGRQTACKNDGRCKLAQQPGEKWDGGQSRQGCDSRQARSEVDGRVSASCRSQLEAGSVVGRGWRTVSVGYHCAAANHGYPVDGCSIYHNSFANFEVYLAVVAADDDEEV
ncbi:hypothetical protein B0H14DRAFT_3133309 [Mycena olivaceomarginata]|nr:hypothetical protein B0H14DRAFT_3133309 [Mycena olivaceomarginata]